MNTWLNRNANCGRNLRIFVRFIQVTWRIRKVIQRFRNNPFTKSSYPVVTKYSNIEVVYKLDLSFHSQITSNQNENIPYRYCCITRSRCLRWTNPQVEARTSQKEQPCPIRRRRWPWCWSSSTSSHRCCRTRSCFLWLRYRITPRTRCRHSSFKLPPSLSQLIVIN